MRFRQLITNEEGEAAASAPASNGATTSSDIATVAYPLFVAGRTRRQKRRNARRAVGQKMNSVPSYVGKGVYESQNVAEAAGLYGPFTVTIRTGERPQSRTKTKKFRREDDAILWAQDWLEDFPQYSFATAEVTDPDGNVVWTTDEQGVTEAHTLNSDNVIYRLDREDPMNASEVLILGGAGRYSMAGLRDKARKEAQALAADLEGNHGGAFRGAAHNIKQLTNTLNTIVAAYNELKRIRSKGGRGSRGITDEDKNFIRECLTIAERWTLQYNQGKKL